jgi:hypothetical protein
MCFFLAIHSLLEKNLRWIGGQIFDPIYREQAAQTNAE